MIPANTPCKWCDTPLSDCDGARPNRKCCPDCRHHKRIQRKRTAGWRMPKGAIYVGRPTKWGNPFRPAMVINRIAMKVQIVRIHCHSTAHAVECYQKWLDGTPFLVGGHDLAPQPPTLAEIRAALHGRDLVCWCPLDQPCHADVLLELANG